jgi:N-acetyltransferase 10
LGVDKAAVNGYEGTGRSLSLKLIQQLREQASGAAAAAGGGPGGGSTSSKALAAAGAGSGGAVGRTFREVTLEEPIR